MADRELRWINRGPDPGHVEAYAREYTPRWVSYFRDRVGARPTDSFWREFRTQLGELSEYVCWYCERRCDRASEVGGRAATLDHFRPLSRFPNLAYDWSNWVFSCHRCNVENKQDRWPENGYVDPAASDEKERPENYFAYDMRTHDVIPRDDLGEDDRRRAWDTIEDLGLNKVDVRFYRQHWMRRLIEDLRKLPIEEHPPLAKHLASYPEFLGTTRMVLAQIREAGELP